MQSKYFRLFFLVVFIIGASAGYLKGCNSYEYPKQHSLPYAQRSKVSKEHPFSKDSTIIVAAGSHYDKNEFHEILFGSHYRDLWSLPVRMQLFDIQTIYGGMKVLKRGGNMQTFSLRLESKDGKRYVLRTIDKDQSQAIGRMWRNKVITYIMRDETAALHPYGALVIPPLAEAAGIYHTNPRLYFIPYDPNFGPYANMFEGRTVILEEFPDKSWTHHPQFGNADSIQSSLEMLHKRYAQQNVTFDQKAFARARLFDLWINDWDRHTDQWKWAEYNQNGKVMYKPIPRDRDIAFFKFDTGLIPRLVVIFNPKFQSFTYKYNIPDMVINANYIDHLIFSGLEEEDFISIARELKTVLTDSLITAAVKSWPPEVFNLQGEEVISKLKYRRGQLEQVARAYYKTTFKEMKLVGSDQKDKFIIERLNKEQTRVTILDEKDSSIFQHTYNHSVTKRINLFGLNGEDRFLIKGQAEDGIEINIYGGHDKDSIKDESYVKGWSRKTIVYDSEDDTVIDGSKETSDKTSDDPKLLFFDRIGIKQKE